MLVVCWHCMSLSFGLGKVLVADPVHKEMGVGIETEKPTDLLGHSEGGEFTQDTCGRMS